MKWIENVVTGIIVALTLAPSVFACLLNQGLLRCMLYEAPVRLSGGGYAKVLVQSPYGACSTSDAWQMIVGSGVSFTIFAGCLFIRPRIEEAATKVAYLFHRAGS